MLETGTDRPAPAQGTDAKRSDSAQSAARAGALAHATNGALVGPYPRNHTHPRDWRDLRRWLAADAHTWGYRVTSPLGALTIAVLLMVAVLGYGAGSSLGAPRTTTSGAIGSGTNSTGMPGMSGMSGTGASTTATQSAVPNATQTYGNQLAK